MKKKIMVVSILAIFMLLALSVSASSIYVLNKTPKESPLFKIRSVRTIREKIERIREKFDGRAFFLPLELINKLKPSDEVQGITNWIGCPSTRETTCSKPCED